MADTAWLVIIVSDVIAHCRRSTTSFLPSYFIISLEPAQEPVHSQRTKYYDCCYYGRNRYDSHNKEVIQTRYLRSPSVNEATSSILVRFRKPQIERRDVNEEEMETIDQQLTHDFVSVSTERHGGPNLYGLLLNIHR